MKGREDKDNFGLDVSNPVPTTSSAESYRYLDRLTTVLGGETSYERQGSWTHPAVPGLIDWYIIFDEDQEKLTDIYICPYFEETSSSAPPGFRLRAPSSDIFEGKNMKQMMQEALEERGVELPGGIDDSDVEDFLEFLENESNPKARNETTQGSGCFIATAAIGNYDDEVVLELRKFRDVWIKKQNWGNTFITFYYHYGQILARHIANKRFLRTVSLYLLVMPTYFFAKTILKNNRTSEAKTSINKGRGTINSKSRN